MSHMGQEDKSLKDEVTAPNAAVTQDTSSDSGLDLKFLNALDSRGMR